MISIGYIVEGQKKIEKRRRKRFLLLGWGITASRLCADGINQLLIDEEYEFEAGNLQGIGRGVSKRGVGENNLVFYLQNAVVG